jgi:hypothetical protein
MRGESIYTSSVEAIKAGSAATRLYKG